MSEFSAPAKKLKKPREIIDERMERVAKHWGGRVVWRTQNGHLYACAVRYPAKTVMESRNSFWMYEPSADGSVTVALLFRELRWSWGESQREDKSHGLTPVVKSAAFLSRLSPTTHPNALEWRRRCWEAVDADAKLRARKASLQPGDRIKLAQPIFFGDGRELDEFEVVSKKRGRRRQTLYRAERGGYYRLPAAALAAASIRSGRTGRLVR